MDNIFKFTLEFYGQYLQVYTRSRTDQNIKIPRHMHMLMDCRETRVKVLYIGQLHTQASIWAGSQTTH